jgi:hypothetical protein
MRKLILTMAAVLAALLGVTLASPAQAISRTTISTTWVTAHANTSNGGSTYTGDVEALVGDHCVNMQRKTSTGSWVTSGFWYSASVEADPARSCNSWTAPGQYWEIHNGAAIYGIRVVENTGNIATFCDTKANCQAL